MEKTKQLIVLVGPPGSGKSTLSRQYVELGYTYVNQDSQGQGHLHVFDMAVNEGDDIIVDRMGFSKGQRYRYLSLAKDKGYKTKIIILHQPYRVCLERVLKRTDHETIKDEKAARSALALFYSKYDRVEDSEADEVERCFPEGPKPMAVICDLDGTLCNVDHRLHFVKKPKGERKDWVGFFNGMENDAPHNWCVDIVKSLSRKYTIVFCSGRPDSYRKQTVEWLEKHEMDKLNSDGLHLYMRNRADSRQDFITKEVILDFELLTRFNLYFCIDDRTQVVSMYRKRGYAVLQCAAGEF